MYARNVAINVIIICTSVNIYIEGIIILITRFIFIAIVTLAIYVNVNITCGWFHVIFVQYKRCERTQGEK